MPDWYYARRGKPHGPVSFFELQDFVRKGSLQPSDLIFTQGMGDWVRAGRNIGLFDRDENSTEIPAKVVIRCPGCGTGYRFDLGRHEGKNGKCKKCGTKFPIQSRAAVDQPPIPIPAPPDRKEPVRVNPLWITAAFVALITIGGIGNQLEKRRVGSPSSRDSLLESSAGDGTDQGSDRTREVKTYKVSKGWGRGSITIELPTDHDLGIEFSDFELTDAGFLRYTLLWRAYEGGNPKAMRWSAYDAGGVKLVGDSLDFGTEIRSGEPTKGEMILGSRHARDTVRITVR